MGSADDHFSRDASGSVAQRGRRGYWRTAATTGGLLAAVLACQAEVVDEATPSVREPGAAPTQGRLGPSRREAPDRDAVDREKSDRVVADRENREREAAVDRDPQVDVGCAS